MNKVWFLILLVFSAFASISAQTIISLAGNVTDQNNVPLTAVSVYVEGTTIGTVTNTDGDFNLDVLKSRLDEQDVLAPTLVFQYVGYETYKVPIDLYTTARYDTQLLPSRYELEVVEVVAGEDPANQIIRETIKHRKSYLNEVSKFQCEVYIKGLQQIVEAPEKFFGVSLNDLGGILDSNRNGIVYFSESSSELYYQAPDQYKEVVKYSKVSGDDNGFGFNSALLLNVDIYKNTENFGRPIVSPIASGAFSYYRYQLEGSTIDKDGNLIYAIKVIPKNDFSTTYSGMIYILGEQYRVHSLDLALTGNAIKEPLLDTLHIRQSYVPIKGTDVWRIFNQTLEFRISVMSLKIEGYFIGIYSNYKLDPVFVKRQKLANAPPNEPTSSPNKPAPSPATKAEKKAIKEFFSGPVLSYKDDANDQTVEFWDSIRQLPLSQTEALDYVKKDSLQEIWNSPAYKDSIDHERNKFKLRSLYSYKYQNSKNKESLSITPWQTVTYNPINGLYVQPTITYLRRFDEKGSHFIRSRMSFGYGFPEKVFRPFGSFWYGFNQKKESRIKLSLGRRSAQFGNEHMVDPFSNIFTAILFQRSHIRLYDVEEYRVSYLQRLFVGLNASASLGYDKAKPLKNTTDYTWKKPKAAFKPNYFPKGATTTDGFRAYQGLQANLTLTYQPGVDYVEYPNSILELSSDWPKFRLKYQYNQVKYLEEGFSDGAVHHLEFKMTGEFNLKRWGNIDYMFNKGWLIGDGVHVEQPLMKHFNGNGFGDFKPTGRIESYSVMPVYNYSTSGNYLEAQLFYNMNGILLDRIPLIRRLGFTEFAVARYMLSSDDEYIEWSIGLDNVGFGAFRLFSIEWATGYNHWKQINTNWLISYKIIF